MSAVASPRPSPQGVSLLSDDALQRLSGPAVFARGQTYASSGAIESLQTPAMEPGEQAAVQALVQGTQAYQVRVGMDAGGKLGGECDCPHAQDGNFCKHLVAVCLAWRGELGGTAPAHDAEAAKKVAAVAKRARTQASNLQALRQFVQGQSAAALAERLWDWAENDRTLMVELKAWSAEHSAAGDPKALRSAIATLLRDRSGFLDWRESGAYAHRAAKVLPMLRPWLQRDPAQLRGLCEHALRCAYKVAEHADDSNGEIGGLLQNLMDLLTEALRASPPPAAWVEHWFALMQADPWGLWDEKSILAAAGPAVRARHAEQALADWKDWQRRHPATAPAGVPAQPVRRYDPERSQLRRRYLDSLALQDDPLALRDAMADSAQQVHEFCELVALCEEQGWFREALQWAEAGLRQHPRDWRCEDDLLRCYERDGWDEEALALWRRRLQARPDVPTYQAVLAAAERAKCDRARYRDELFAWAEQREQKELEAARKRPRTHAAGESALRSIDVRVCWLLADAVPQQALALVRQPGNGCRLDTLEALARKLPAENHADAVQLLQRVFDAEMAVASSPYARPLALVQDILARMPLAQQAPWLAELRTRYKPKRNFIAGLP